MPSTRYSEYDTFARMHNESWGPQVSELVLPDLEQLLLQYLPQGAYILDLCCGTGQLAQKLLRKGYQVTGLDGSEEMLRYARENAPSSEFILDDARFFKLPPTFHGVVSTSYCLNHVTSIEELARVFHNVYEAMLANSLFMFDLNLDERYRGGWNNSMEGDIKQEYAWALRRNYESEERIGKIDVTIFQLIDNNWQRLDKTWLVKGYYQNEIISSLKNAGFAEINIYDAKRNLTEDGASGTVYFVCHKQDC